MTAQVIGISDARCKVCTLPEELQARVFTLVVNDGVSLDQTCDRLNPAVTELGLPPLNKANLNRHFTRHGSESDRIAYHTRNAEKALRGASQTADPDVFKNAAAFFGGSGISDLLQELGDMQKALQEVFKDSLREYRQNRNSAKGKIDSEDLKILVTSSKELRSVIESVRKVGNPLLMVTNFLDMVFRAFLHEVVDLYITSMNEYGRALEQQITSERDRAAVMELHQAHIKAFHSRVTDRAKFYETKTAQVADS